MPSLQEALPAETPTLHTPFLALTSRILGAAPRFSATAHSSPFTIKFYFGGLRSCMRIPLCDFGLTALTPHHRQLALLESSLVHGCAYCVAHCVGMGDVVHGSLLAQRAARVGAGSEEGDDVLRRVVREACRIPGAVSDGTRKAFVKVFGEGGYAELTSMLAFMGWLNFTMAAVGMRIEGRMAAFTRIRLSEVDGGEGIDLEKSIAEDGEEGIGEREVAEAFSGGIWSVAKARLWGMWGFVRLVPAVVATLREEQAWFEGVPSGEGVVPWVEGLVGARVEAVRIGADDVVRRALAFGIREGLVAEGAWSRWERCAMMFIFGREIGDVVVARDAARMAGALKGDGEAVVMEELERVFEEAGTGGAEGRFKAAARFVRVCAGHAGGVTDAARGRLLKEVEEALSVVDVAGLVGLFAFAHRVVVLAGGERGV